MSFAIKDFSDIKKLSEGGMGSVYLATQLSLNRKVVIKELASNLHNEPQLIKRFENEAKSAAALNHENIIRVFDFGEDRKSFFITMEYIDGWNLDQIMHWQPFRKEIGLMILVQAMKGLNYAHKHGTVHCDIKPGNILVSKTGSVKVVDFGLAHASSQTADSNDKSSIFITPSYVPPEVATGSGNQDIFTDIWSMGVLAYRITCGRLPFVGEDIRKLVYSIVHEKEKDIQMIVPSLPDDLAESFRGCLRKNPKDRIASLDPVIESLEKFIYDLGVRDIEKMVMNYVSDRHSVDPALAGLLLQYHMQKGNEYLDAGNSLKSDVHFREAEKYGALDLDFTASKISSGSRGRFTGPYRQRTSHPQAGRSIIPSLGIFTKSKSIKRKISIIGIISFFSLCTASAFLIVQKTQTSASKAVKIGRAHV
jgi:serine/threonine protein kinase